MIDLCKAIMVGGSAGALDVLLKVLPHLQPILPFPIILVLHRKSGNDSILTELLAANTPLKVKEAEEKQKITNGTIYIAPSNYHLLIENNFTFSIDASEKINYSRPSIDVTFQCAAEVYRNGLVGILLSGANTDGTLGLLKIKNHGGITVVQDPSTAFAPFMIENAMHNVKIDEILKVENLAHFINQLGLKKQ